MASSTFTTRLGVKCLSIGRQIPKTAIRLGASRADYEQAPPIFLTTIPKSGTHLLRHACASLPGIKDWGSFLVRHPAPMRYLREQGPGRPPAALARQVQRIVPGELFTSHLHFSSAVADAARQRNAFIILLVRDPRSIAVSDAHYMSETRWHPHYSAFRHIDREAQLHMVIEGMEAPERDFRDIGCRLRGFLCWADHVDLVLRYEDLRLDPEAALRGLATQFRTHVGKLWSIDSAVRVAMEAVDPGASHTFREGRTDGWKEELDAGMMARIESLASDYMDRFDYSSTL